MPTDAMLRRDQMRVNWEWEYSLKTRTLCPDRLPWHWVGFEPYSLVGTNSDATGSVVPGASITATNQRTHVSVTVTAENSGDYVVTPLQVGTYR